MFYISPFLSSMPFSLHFFSLSIFVFPPNDCILVVIYAHTHTFQNNRIRIPQIVKNIFLLSLPSKQTMDNGKCMSVLHCYGELKKKKNMNMKTDICIFIKKLIILPFFPYTICLLLFQKLSKIPMEYFCSLRKGINCIYKSSLLWISSQT